MRSDGTSNEFTSGLTGLKSGSDPTYKTVTPTPINE